MIRGGNGIGDRWSNDAKFREVMEAVESRGCGHKENARCITFYPDNLFYFFPVTFPLRDWVGILYHDD